MHPLLIIKEEVKEHIHSDFELELLNDQCGFAEGPVWNKEGYYLFSDIPSNIISKIKPGEAKEVFLFSSGCDDPENAELPRMMGSNGLTYLGDELLICQHGNHAIAKYDGKNLQPYINTYNNQPLNSPNDIVAHPNGTVFFSDPPYGLKDQKINADKYQPLAAFYCWKDGALKMFCKEYQYPNGLCLSPDQNLLYTCSNKPAEAFVLEFDAHSLELRRTVCQENSDGIKADPYGNLYLCNKDGILIINQKGERIGLIQLPTTPANCCWGGEGLKDLFICARENIFLIRNLLK